MEEIFKLLSFIKPNKTTNCNMQGNFRIDGQRVVVTTMLIPFCGWVG